jgi:hypothetical protein
MATTNEAATLTIRVPGSPFPIAFQDWIHDRKFASCQFNNGWTTRIDVFGSGPGQAIPGGTRMLNANDTNLDRQGTSGLSPGNEALVYAIKLTQKALGFNAGAAVGPGDPRVPAMTASLFDLNDKLQVDFQYNRKTRSEGVFCNYPSGKGIYTQSVVTGQEVVHNGVPSPRDQLAFVMPLWLRENIGFNLFLTPVVALVQNWAFVYAAQQFAESYCEVHAELEGLIQKPVS